MTYFTNVPGQPGISTSNLLKTTVALQILSAIRRCTTTSLVIVSLFLSVKVANAQTCGSTTWADIATTPATCPGNGSITAPTLATTTIYQLSGGGIAGEIQQNSPVFGSLAAGTYSLTLLCAGEGAHSIPDIIVADANSPLGLSLTGTMACTGTGTIDAVATGGFNNGGTGVNYQYAMWTEADGGANRTDTGLPYSSASSFGGGSLTEGKYFVRVKDSCGNIFTQSIILKPSKPVGKASLGTPTVNCTGGSFNYTYPNAKLVDPSGATITDFSTPQYKYRVEQVSAGACNTDPASVISTPIPDTDITAATTLTDPISGILPGQSYRVVITSPCGTEQVATCFVAADLNLEVKPSRLCEDSDSLRVTINLYTSAAYAIEYPITIDITKAGATGSETIVVTTWQQLIAIQKNYAETDFPLTVTATDACGLSKTVIKDAPPTGGGPSFLAFGYRFSCAENGNVSASVWPEGNWYGLEYNSGTDADKTKYELINTATNTVVSTLYGLSTVANNELFFPNIPAGATYIVRATPPASVSSTCGPQDSNPMTIPATQGMNFTVTPTVEKICNDGLNSIQYNAVNNTGGTLTYKLYEGTDATGTLISTLATPAHVPSGTYYYEVVRPSSEGTCPSATRSGTIDIDAWQTNPTISRSLALNCQPLGSGPQATGQAQLQFSGFGPFVVERSIDGGPFEVVDPAAVSSYSESSLEAGKVYTYRVTDQCGKSVSQQVMIKPLSPRLTSNTQEPCNGTDYTLSAIDFGDPLTTYKWEKDGVVLANTREYTLTNFQPANNGVYKLTVSLLNGCIVRETYITLNSANCGDPFATGSLGNKVWYDTNSDGIQAATGEAGVPNVPVTLQGYVGPNQASPSAADLANNAYWAEVDNKTTDANGEYLFGGLETGYYRVKFGTVANYGFTDPNAGGDATVDSDAGAGGFSGPVYINSQGVGIDKDNPTIDAGLVPAGSIGDYVWTDEDHDGIQDTDEDPKAGVTVKLYVKNGSVWDEVATTVTGTDGKYLFSGLPAGTYQVEFTLPGGMVFTNANVVSASDDEDSDADMVTGKTGEIIIDPSQAETSVLRNNMSIDAGITTALPVKLSRFDVKKGENVSALLRWTTTEEVNSDSFEIQRSADAKSWNAIGQVKAKENNVGLVNYRFDDMQPNLGANYYRLKMIDLDGSFAYSSIRKLSGDMGAELTIYPNPVSNELSIQSTIGQAIGKVELINQSGKVVLTKNGSSIASPINVKNLPAGIYLVKISFQNGAVENRKVIITR